jgi:hypothetical protein
MFGLNTRFVTRCEWLTLRPAEGLLPQTAHTFDIELLLLSDGAFDAVHEHKARETITQHEGLKQGWPRC